MTLAGFAWLTGSLLPVAIFWHRGPLVHLCVTYPTGRLRRRLAVMAVGVAYVDGLVKPIASNDVVTLAVAVLVAVAAVDVFVRTSGPARRSGAIALASALAYAGTLAAGALVRLFDLDADETVLILYDAVVASIAIVLLLELLFGRWTEETVADLVVALGERAGTGTLRDQLAKALGDPSLIVGYWIAEPARYVDDGGRPVELPVPGEDRAVTEIDDDGNRVAVLVHDPATMDDPRLVAAVAAAARLSVVNARLQAEIQGRVSEVAESRRRIVEAVDDQRRRLERELSEGAQRRLDGVLRLVDGARCAAPAVEAAGLNELEVEIRAAQAELRDFAQGIRPSALDQGGLAAALPVLAERVPVPVDLDIDVGRVPPAIEAAVFFVCSEALANVAKHALAQRVSAHGRAERRRRGGQRLRRRCRRRRPGSRLRLPRVGRSCRSARRPARRPGAGERRHGRHGHHSCRSWWGQGCRVHGSMTLPVGAMPRLMSRDDTRWSPSSFQRRANWCRERGLPTRSSPHPGFRSARFLPRRAPSTVMRTRSVGRPEISSARAHGRWL